MQQHQMLKAVAVVVVTFASDASANTMSNHRFARMMRARSLSANGLPDPKCHSGVLGKNGVCCAGYCGECSDYATCSSVRGQDSEGACCASKVFDLRCGGGAPANKCLKSCSESVPPCIMDEEAPPAPAATRHAGSDCNEAVSDWRLRASGATTP